VVPIKAGDCRGEQGKEGGGEVSPRARRARRGISKGAQNQQVYNQVKTPNEN